MATSYFSTLQQRLGTVETTDRFLFESVTSSKFVMAFYYAVDYGFFFRMKVQCTNFIPETVFALWEHRMVRKVKMLATLLLTVALYYADIVKDILLAAEFKSKVLGQIDWSEETFSNKAYPLIVFSLTVLSIVATEVLNIFLALTDDLTARLGYARRTCAAILTPLLPGVTLYIEKKKELEDVELCHSSLEAKDGIVKKQEPGDNVGLLSRLEKLHGQADEVRQLRAKIRANENVVEHFVQLCLFFVVILAELSSTRSVQTVGKFFLVDNRGFVFLSIGLSLLSIVRGHINYVAVRKRGHLPTIGMLFLAVYFALSCFARVWAVVVFFTPLLGLFDTLEMGRTGLLPASNDTVFDFHANDSVITLADEWNDRFQFNSISDLLDSDALRIACLAIPPAVVAFHLFAGLAIRAYFHASSSTRWEVFFTLVCPPIFNDWEDYYRLKPGTTIEQAWKTSLIVLAIHVGLHALENAALCVPLCYLKLALYDRKIHLASRMFSLLPQEEHSAMMVNLILFSSLTAFAILVPALQFMLALAYFWHGHAWSRIIKRKKHY